MRFQQRSYHRAQPKAPVEPNWGSPVACGLDFLYCGSAGIGLFDLVRNIRAENFGVITSTPAGVSSALASDTGMLPNSGSPGSLQVSAANSAHLNYTAAGYSWWARVYCRAVSGTPGLTRLFGRHWYNSEGTNAGWGLSKYNLGIIAYHFANNTTTNYQTLGSVTWTAGVTYDIAFVGVAANNGLLYLNGKLLTFDTNASLPASNTANGVGIASSSSGNDFFVTAAATWRRAITAQDVNWLYQEPWQLYAPQRQRTWTIGAPAPGGGNMPLIVSGSIVGGNSRIGRGLIV